MEEHMIKRVIIGSFVALALIGAGIGIGASANGAWGPRHDAVVVSGGGTGSGAANAGQTIVVSDGHYGHGFFFPFGLLFFGLVLFFVVSLFRRGGRGGGPCRRGGGPGSSGGPRWLEEWHRRTHEGEATTPNPEQASPA
jgi:hypothetical protein